MLLSAFWDLIFAVGVGLIISCLIFMKLIGDLTAKYSEIKGLKEEAWPDEMELPSTLKNDVFIKHIKGPLFLVTPQSFSSFIHKFPSKPKQSSYA